MFSLIPIAGIAIGIGLLAWAARVWRRGEATRRWLVVQGEITGVQVQERRDYDRDNTGQAGITHEARITYRYSVRGHTYDGSRLALGWSPTSQSRDAALSKVASYRPGLKVKVFHDPADPAYAVLEVGAQYTVVVLLLFMAAMFIGISVVLLR
jgi:hypothetical protein